MAGFQLQICIPRTPALNVLLCVILRYLSVAAALFLLVYLLALIVASSALGIRIRIVDIFALACQ